MLKKQKKSLSLRQQPCFSLAKTARNSHNAIVSNICAIIVHKPEQENLQTCLNRLQQQSHQPDHILVVTPVQGLSIPAALTLQVDAALGSMGAAAKGLEYAFTTLQADAAWVLADRTWPRPSALAQLLAAEADETTIRMGMMIDPAKGDELSQPISIPGKTTGVWIPITHKADLPDEPCIPCRTGSYGALISRQAWQTVGTPAEQLHTQGCATYSWEIQQAGYQLVTVRAAEIELPAAVKPLIHYRLANRSFFYEPGIPVARQYYKTRNWAWLHRLQAPRNYPARLILCGVYILFSLNAMLQCNELGIKRVYNLFRALHNGFYGKLRPY